MSILIVMYEVVNRSDDNGSATSECLFKVCARYKVKKR